jgi:hypothetical protein
MYKRIQLRFAAAIQFRDPRQMRIDKLHGRNSPRPNLLSHLHSRKKIQFIHSELNKNHANAPASLARTPSPHAPHDFDFVAAHCSAPSPWRQPAIEARQPSQNLGVLGARHAVPEFTSPPLENDPARKPNGP